MITTVAWFEWYLRSPNALFVFLCALSEVLSTQHECCDWCVFVCVCTFGDTPSSKLAGPFFFSLYLRVCLPPSFSHSLSLTRSFLSLFTSPLYVCLFPPPPFVCLSPPTEAVCIPARRGGGVCDPGSIRTRPPLHAALPRVRPHPLPGKMGAPSSLAGHRLPFECAASHGSRDLT